MRPRSSPAPRARGFTLTELAVVVAIVALLIGGTLMTLAAQNAAREVSDTQRTLETARDAIVGFALQNGRLPCPASDGSPDVSGVATVPSGGAESFCTSDLPAACGAHITVPPYPAHGRCSNPRNGYLPAASLGLGPTGSLPNLGPPPNNSGFLLDAWNNGIRYAVTDWNWPGPTPPALNNVFTASGGMKQVGFAQLDPTLNLFLRVCSAAGPTTVDLVCPPGGGPQFNTPAVIFSLGKNWALPGPGTDELENIDGDWVFVSRPPSPSGSAAQFDDIVIWLSPNVLYNRLIAAGAI